MPNTLTNVLLAASAASIATVSPVFAQKPSASAGAVRVADVFGTVEKRVGNGSYSRVKAGDTLSAGFMLRTADDSAVLLQVPVKSSPNKRVRVRIGAKSVVRMQQSPPGSPGVTYSCTLLSGQAWAMVPAKDGDTFAINTPSATAQSQNGLFGVGYDLETDQSVASVGEGSASVSLASGGWSGTAKARQYVRYLRRPQPNVRLRSPEVAAQTPEQEAMWRLLRTENWTRPDLLPNTPPRILRGNETRLRGMLQTVTVAGGAR